MEQRILRILYFKKRIIFPFCTLSVALKSSDDTKEIKQGDKILALTIRSTIDTVLYCNRLATLSEVMEAAHDDQTVKLTLKGLFRVRIKRIMKFKQAEFSLVENERTESYDAIMDDLRKKSQELVFLINVEESDKLIKLLNYIVDLNQMTDFIANYFVMDFRKRYRLYNEIGVKKRGLLLIFELSELISDMTKKRKKISL
jgi:ATP-dependent Lon protease